MRKRIVLTMLDDNPGLAQALGREMSRMGLDVAAHLWTDDLQNHAWAQAGRELAGPGTRLWLIVGSVARLGEKSIRQGLALAALAAQAEHGAGFDVLISPSGGGIDMADLPTPLRGAQDAGRNPAARAAVVAAKPVRRVDAAYRIVPHAPPGLGLWLETGPRDAPWRGAFLAAAGIAPDVQGIGPAGVIPARTTLHHPVRGMRLSLGGRDYEGCGAHNDIAPADSHYARLGGVPDAVVFGPFPDTDDAELFSIDLCQGGGA